MDERQKRVARLADAIYGGIRSALKDADVDAGEGIAICMLLSGWLKGSADAQKVLTHRGLADMPYFTEADDD